VAKKHDKATTPYHRTLNDSTVDIAEKAILIQHYQTLNPAAIQREILALAQLVTADITPYPDTAHLLLADTPK
jgi:hypothetical protein